MKQWNLCIIINLLFYTAIIQYEDSAYATTASYAPGTRQGAIKLGRGSNNGTGSSLQAVPTDSGWLLPSYWQSKSEWTKLSPTWRQRPHCPGPGAGPLCIFDMSHAWNWPELSPALLHGKQWPMEWEAFLPQSPSLLPSCARKIELKQRFALVSMIFVLASQFHVYPLRLA